MSTPLEPGDFAEYFREVHGRSPFPWQARLCDTVLASGWPDALHLPPGVDRAAVLDVAVFALASSTDAVSRSHPLRIVHLVDRRPFADPALARARRIAAALRSAPGGSMRERVARRLVEWRPAAAGEPSVPLLAQSLTAPVPGSDLWTRRPDQPTILVATVDTVGSALLFRGDGIGDSMRPVHAGLLGNDCLYLCDELHRSEAFAQTLRSIAGRYLDWAEHPLPRRLSVVAMPATASAEDGAEFRLSKEDREHAELRRRLDARRPARLLECAGGQFVRTISAQVEEWCHARKQRIAVVVNRVDHAVEITRQLEESQLPADVELVTGRMRPIDRLALEARLLARSGAERGPEGPDRPLIVVTTQCLETGAELDFDALLTECASLDALRRRLRLLNRLGNAEDPCAVVLARRETLARDPIYGEALGRTWSFLRERSGADGFDFCESRFPAFSGAELDAMRTPAPAAPVLLPAHLDLWSHTSPPLPEPDPEVGPWLHGPELGAAEVRIVWRCGLPNLAATRALTLRPRPAEALSIPFAVARRWLHGDSSPALLADVEGSCADQDSEGSAGPARSARPFLRWTGDATVELADPSTLRPGDTIVVPGGYGGLFRGTFDPGAVDPVVDLAEIAALQQGRTAALRLRPEVLQRLWSDAAASELGIPVLPADPHAEDRDALRSRVTEWLRATPRPTESAWIPAWEALREAEDLRVERCADDGTTLLVRAHRRLDGMDDSDLAETASTDGDHASFGGRSVPLGSHQEGVAAWATRFANVLGLPSRLERVLAEAGRRHDGGKADPRFQLLLHGGCDFRRSTAEEALAQSSVELHGPRARSRAAERSGYPSGARHEFLSVAMLEKAPLPSRPMVADWDLLLHLIGSHHGHCRPWVPFVADPAPVTFRHQLGGVELSCSSDHGLAALDSGVVERYARLVRRYGWWGLAFLESLLRLADHQRSLEEEDAR